MIWIIILSALAITGTLLILSGLLVFRKFRDVLQTVGLIFIIVGSIIFIIVLLNFGFSPENISSCT